MNTEYLDYCRVKKIFEKGFGFLTSLYFEENVFFHFSKIKDQSVKEKLEKLKRGEVYLFYTSKSVKGRRRVEKIWFDVQDIDSGLIPPFTLRIIEELKEGKINVFELANVVLLLRQAGSINKIQFKKILNAERVRRFPSSIAKMLTPKEMDKFDDLQKLIDDIENGEIDYKDLTGHVLEKIFGN